MVKPTYRWRKNRTPADRVKVNSLKASDKKKVKNVYFNLFLFRIMIRMATHAFKL